MRRIKLRAKQKYAIPSATNILMTYVFLFWFYSKLDLDLSVKQNFSIGPWFGFIV